MFALQQNVVLSTISNQIRLDAAALQAQAALANVPDATLTSRLEAAFNRLDVLPLDDVDEGEEEAAAG